MPDVQVLAPGVKAAPLDYVIPGAQEILVKAIAADFDGSGAGGSFVPAIQIIAPGNKLAGTFIANGQVAAGDSVSVSWAPFLAGAGPNGIQFDVDNIGGTLRVVTTGNAPVTGDGIYMEASNGGGLELVGDGFATLRTNDGAFTIEAFGPSAFLQMISAGGTLIEEQSSNSLTLNNTGGGQIEVQTTGGGTQIYTSEDGFIFNSTHTATGLVAFAVRVRTGDIFAVENGSAANAILLSVGPAGVVCNLPTNTTFQINDHNGAAILRVNENGPAYHIKTGKAWVADL